MSVRINRAAAPSPGSACREPTRSCTRALVFFALAALAALPASPADAQIIDRAQLVAALDSAARAHVGTPMVAGVSVAVVRGAHTLLTKGYGFVDLEWKVPTPTDGSASYEIGSMTKQFTATAILQLVEQGKLDLDADFTKYLPEFDTHGHTVPLRRLLDHTSGIKGYTEMPVFGELSAKKLPRDTLVSLVEAEPFEFEPGTAAIYNNSAYFLLGLIIEKVSGKSYADFVEEHLFAPAGMSNSYYCSESAIRPGRAHGYDGGREGLSRKSYLDHTWPFAAGSLCSTTGDLINWNRALHGGRMLRPGSYAELTTPRPLVDGTPTEYAMGLGISTRGDHRLIAHGGGIPGYLSDGQYFPDDSVLIVVLQNSTAPRGPDALANAFADLIFGEVPAPTPVSYTGSLDALIGEYAGPARGGHLHVSVTRDGNQLVLTNAGQDPRRPIYQGDGVWIDGGRRVGFVLADGKARELRISQGAGRYVLERVAP